MQPVISSFMFSEDTKETNLPNGGVGGVNIINPQNIIRPAFVPGSYSFSVSIGLLSVDPEREHTLQFKLISKNAENVIDTGVIQLPKGIEFDNTLPKEANGFMFNMNFRNVPFRHSGTYTGSVLFDNETLGNYPLVVYPQELV